MLDRDSIRGLALSEEFAEPQTDKKVFPLQYCPKYQQRYSITPVIPECYFCRFADFHLNMNTPPETGECHYPEIVHDLDPTIFVPWSETEPGHTIAKLDSKLKGG